MANRKWFFMLCLSKAEGRAKRWPAEAEVLEQLVVLLVVVERAVRKHGIAPFEAVADADHALPGEAGRAGTEVEVVRGEPGRLAPPETPAYTDDAVDETRAPRSAAGGRKTCAPPGALTVAFSCQSELASIWK